MTHTINIMKCGIHQEVPRKYILDVSMDQGFIDPNDFQPWHTSERHKLPVCEPCAIHYVNAAFNNKNAVVYGLELCEEQYPEKYKWWTVLNK